QMQTCLARALLLVKRKSCVVQPERTHDVIVDITIQTLPADDFNEPADPVETSAIGPPGIWIEHQRRTRQRCIPARCLAVATDIRVPKLIAKPGCVRQQITQRDRLSRGAQLRSSLRIET